MSDGAAITADYLVQGAGAMGMAFADQLFTDTGATIVIVDRHDRPGGHWNEAYPFVRLHQPAGYYGVGSTPLGTGAIDQVGLNVGFHELASGQEVLAHFDTALRHRLLPSGRVTFLSSSEVDDDGVVTSLLSGARTRVEHRRFVDATHSRMQVPATTPPAYAIADGVTCVPVGRLRAIHPDRLELEQGTIAARADSCYVDCSAAGIPKVPSTPIFAGRRITPQWIRTCQPTFSAAFIAHVEATFPDDDDQKNRVCRPIVPPSVPLDWLRMLRVQLDNRATIGATPELQAWQAGTRLDAFWSTARVRLGVDQEATAHTGAHDLVRSMLPGVDLFASPGGACGDLRGATIVPGAGHWIQQEAPEAVNAALDPFLAGL